MREWRLVSRDHHHSLQLLLSNGGRHQVSDKLELHSDIANFLAKKKAEASRGSKQQTRKGRAKQKQAVGKDLVTSSENDKSPDLNRQEDERPAPDAASNDPSPVPPSEPQVKNAAKQATKSKAVHITLVLSAQYLMFFFLRLLREVKRRRKIWTNLAKIVRNVLFNN